MKINELGRAALMAGVLAFVAVPAQAVMTLTLDAGGGAANVRTIADGSALDFNPGAGAITWFGSVGGWAMNISSGISNSPGVLGQSAFMDLTSVNQYNGGGVGTIKIDVTDSGWTTPVGPLTARTDVGGTLSSGTTASFLAQFNGTTIASFGPFASTAFSASSATEVAAVSGYGLAGSAIISSFSGAPSSSFDLITTVPEPTLLGLFGLGLLGLGFLRHRRVS